MYGRPAFGGKLGLRPMQFCQVSVSRLDFTLMSHLEILDISRGQLLSQIYLKVQVDAFRVPTQQRKQTQSRLVDQAPL